MSEFAEFGTLDLVQQNGKHHGHPGDAEPDRRENNGVFKDKRDVSVGKNHFEVFQADKFAVEQIFSCAKIKNGQNPSAERDVTEQENHNHKGKGQPKQTPLLFPFLSAQRRRRLQRLFASFHIEESHLSAGICKTKSQKASGSFSALFQKQREATAAASH